MTPNDFPRPGWITLRAKRLPLSIKLDRRVRFVFVVLILLLLISLAVSVSYGVYNIPVPDVLRAIVGLEASDPNFPLVVRVFRLPRILVSLLVGASLAASGAIIQGLTRNDLADPGLLGIAGGAGVVVVGYLTFVAMPDPQLMAWLAFGGAMGASAIIYLLTWKGGSSTMRLILVGIGLSALCGALISYFLTRLTVEDARRANIWLTGSVYGSTWADVVLMLQWLIPMVIIALLLARQLNVLGLGDDLATGLGTRIERYRLILIALSAGLAAITVTVAGTIAFVGFVAPHIARRLVGPSHEGLLLTTVLTGGLLLVISDLASRWVLAPTELPIGVTTAVIGAPYFAYLLYRRGR